MPGTSLEILVGGRWLSLDSRYGDIEMSTVYPGGSDQVSWVPGTQSPYRFGGGELVEVRFGGVVVWSGRLIEPDPSQEQMVAQGAWREGDDYVALDSGGAATAIPDTAITQAIARGLLWTRPTSIATTAVAIDISQGPVSVGELLDGFGENNGQNWVVSPTRIVSAVVDPTTPIYQTLPQAGGNGYALDGYASTLIGRYINMSGAYATATITDTVAEALHGHVEAIVDLTPKGNIAAAGANSVLTKLLAKGRSTPQWTAPLSLSYGELLNMGGTPVALETAAAGQIVRVHGGYELAQRLNGAMYVDMLIGATSLSGGLLTVRPMQLAARNFRDLLDQMLAKK